MFRGLEISHIALCLYLVEFSLLDPQKSSKYQSRHTGQLIAACTQRKFSQSAQ